MGGLLYALALLSRPDLVAPVPVLLSAHNAAQAGAGPLMVADAPARVTHASEPLSVKPSVYAAPMVVASALTFQTLPWPWGCISWHESTWSTTAINPATQDSGAFGIDYRNWDKFKTASMPWYIPSASLAQQFQVAQAVQAAYGWGMWETAPLCGE